MATEGSIVALGTFDGVHSGHMALIDTALEVAARRGLRCVAYTFCNHPMELFGRAPRPLMSWEERRERLAACGLEVEAERFTREFAALSPKEFAALLKSRFNAAVAVAGFNYSFGAGGKGNTALLGALGRELGFDVAEIPPAYYNGEVISSTRIRECLEAGDVAAANAMLGREYTLSGCVVSNRRIGGGLGYPTANITSGKVLPAQGVYATWAYSGGRRYKAVTNIGSNPTVQGTYTTIETHLLDFSGDLYGSGLTVAFVARLRGDRRFASLQELAEQIGRDTVTAREILA